MVKGNTFKLKEDESCEVEILLDEVQEIVPDADMRFSLVILRNGDKHFVYGLKQEIWAALDKDLR